MEKDIKEYEIAFLGLDERVAEQVLGALKRLGGEAFFEGPVEKIALAYKVNKESAAYFGYLHFRLSPENVEPLHRELSANPSVLRLLIITPPLLKSKSRWTPRSRIQDVPEPLDKRRIEPMPLSNEALEKKIEEILQ